MKHIITIILLILTFDLSAQNGDPIPIWKEIIPDTIYLSKNIDTILIPSICQDILKENSTYKKFHFYYHNGNEYDEGGSFKVYKNGIVNCNEIYCPKDSIQKYNLTELASLIKSQDDFEIKYFLVEKNSIAELEALNKTEYILKFELRYKGEIKFSQKITVASNKKWKTLNPVLINVWQLNQHEEKIISLDITENYLDENKVNLRQTRRIILKI